MFKKFNLIFVILQLGCCVLVNYASPVTNFNSGSKSDTFVFELPKSKDAQSLYDRVSLLSASGRSYGDTSSKNQPANGRILSQSSIPDKDAITYPDDIIRDSYGNIVTPYTTLVDSSVPENTPRPKPTEIGVLTDVNKEQQITLPFVIPSYADGITQVQGPYKPSLVGNAIAPPIQTLLPPLSNGNYNYPSLTSAYKPTDNSYQNEILGSFSSSGLGSNSAPTRPTAVTTNGHIGNVNNPPNLFSGNLQSPTSSQSAQSLGVINVQPSSLSQPNTGTYTGQFAKPSSSVENSPVVHGSSDFSAIQVSSSSSELNGQSTFPILSNTKPHKDTQLINQIPIQIQNDNGKYTGGFGGAPGILGDQKTPGYAVKPSANKLPPSGINNKPITTQFSNDHPSTNIIPAQSQYTQNSNNHGFNQGIQSATSQPTFPSLVHNQQNVNLPKPIGLNQSGTYNSNVGNSNSNHGSFQFGTAISTHNTQSNDNNKYTGGFGGPPGVLVPFDNVKPAKTSDHSSTGAQNKY